MAWSDNYTQALAVTPSDVTSYTNTQFMGGEAAAVYCGVAGDITLRVAGGTTVLFKGVPAGTIIPFRHTRVMSTGTTATNIVSLGW